MKTLIVEDEFVARTLIQKSLAGICECHAAVSGQEAIDAFRAALDEGAPYDLICLDIMMPQMDGHQTLRAIRDLETARDIHGLSRVKVIMTTALDDSKNILTAFRQGCEAYMVKPLNKAKLLTEIEKLGLPVDTVPATGS